MSRLNKELWSRSDTYTIDNTCAVTHRLVVTRESNGVAVMIERSFSHGSELDDTGLLQYYHGLTYAARNAALEYAILESDKLLLKHALEAEATYNKQYPPATPEVTVEGT